MIKGIGIDIVSVERIKRSVKRFGDRFAGRIMTEREAETGQGRRDYANWLAGRWAAKESAAKALGSGFGRGIGWKDIEVIKDAAGCPSIRYHGKALEKVQELKIVRTHLSITHDAGSAAAVVILESRDAGGSEDSAN